MKPVSWKVPRVLLRCCARCPEELDAKADRDGAQHCWLWDPPQTSERLLYFSRRWGRRLHPSAAGFQWHGGFTACLLLFFFLHAREDRAGGSPSHPWRGLEEQNLISRCFWGLLLPARSWMEGGARKHIIPLQIPAPSLLTSSPLGTSTDLRPFASSSLSACPNLITLPGSILQIPGVYRSRV